MGLIKLAAAGAIGYALYKYAVKNSAGEPAVDRGCPDVRDAGPESMTSPPKSWSATDEALDESFPASDPPSTY